MSEQWYSSMEGDSIVKCRALGLTGMKVSEVGFGAWAIGGSSCDAVNRKDSLSAHAKAEELGCNFADRALVYGDAELVLAEFLERRRHRWLVATKYSGQKVRVVNTIEEQLKRMWIDNSD